MRKHHAAAPGRDDTTRYLCAAAHLDDDFADNAIREFLVESTRAAPPSPGVQAGAVLAEAVAARARRKIRDGMLLALLVLAVIVLSWSFLIGWVVVGLLVALSIADADHKADRTDLVRRLLPAAGIAVVGAVMVVYFNGLAGPDGGVVGSGPGYGSGSESGDAAGAVLSVLLFALLLTVLLVDEFMVWRHLNDRFGRGAVVSEPAPEELSVQHRQVYTFGSERFLAELRRQLRGHEARLAPPRRGEKSQGNGAEHGAASVVVARGYRMFVGAGQQHEPWSIAVPLRPREDGGQVEKLTAAALYRRVGEQLGTLRTATDLSPDRRFADLTVTEQIVVAAEELIDHDDAAARDFLANRNVPPYPMLRGHRVRELRDEPLEWARYYLCCQLETWDRDFVVSAYLHLAVHASTLYLEWTPCVLLPIRERYRVIDSWSDSPLPPVARALLNLVALPATAPARLLKLCTRIKRQHRTPNVVSPDMFGARYSLRELAADADVHNYFQLADRERYLKVLESRLTLAIIEAMDAAGYSVATLEQQVAAVANNNVYITNGSFTGNMVTGRGNTAGSAAATRAPAAKGAT